MSPDPTPDGDGSTGVDPETLRQDVDRIAEAMGLAERSSGAVTQWLVFAALVPLAAVISQWVYLQQLPQWYHGVGWIGLLGGGGLLSAVLVFDEEDRVASRDDRPGLFLPFAAVYFATFPIQAIYASVLPELSYARESQVTLGVILVLVGVAYAVLGNALRGWRIRARDRYPFYAGTVWMVVLGVAIPYVPVVGRWGYAVFGGVYAVYGVGTYLLLRD